MWSNAGLGLMQKEALIIASPQAKDLPPASGKYKLGIANTSVPWLTLQSW